MSTIAAGTTSGTALVSSGDTTGQLVLQTNGTTTAVTIGTNQVVTLAQPLPVASGGTNSTATPTAGGVGYGTGTALAYTSAGTSGQFLQSNGAGAPTWATPSSGGMTLLATVTPTNGAASAAATGLTSSKQFIVVLSGITQNGNTTISISADNGSTYVGTFPVSTQGTADATVFITPANAGTRKTISILYDISGGRPSYGQALSGTVNAIRINSDVSFAGGGSMYIYGMN